MQDAAESDEDSAEEDKPTETPGDYPGVDDLDTVDDARLWTKLSGGLMAETGLTAPRLLRNEDKDRGGNGEAPWKAMAPEPLSTAGPEMDEKASTPSTPGAVLPTTWCWTVPRR